MVLCYTVLLPTTFAPAGLASWGIGPRFVLPELAAANFTPAFGTMHMHSTAQKDLPEKCHAVSSVADNGGLCILENSRAGWKLVAMHHMTKPVWWCLACDARSPFFVGASPPPSFNMCAIHSYIAGFRIFPPFFSLGCLLLPWGCLGSYFALILKFSNPSYDTVSL